MNISASNNYFNKKKEKYKESGIAICEKLGNSSLTEWSLDNIAKNDERICSQIKDLFKRWIADYEPEEILQTEPPIPTEEDLAMMKILRAKGLIPESIDCRKCLKIHILNELINNTIKLS